MYKVILHFSFGSVFMTKNRQPNGEQCLFDTLGEAERAGRSTGVVYEAVRI